MDLTHHSREFLDRRLGGILEIYEKFTGQDPREQPMEIFPAVHYSMGGIWTDFQRTREGRIDHESPRNQMTSIPGLYAAGEAEYQYHGANRLGANSLLSCIYTGLMMGPGVVNYIKGVSKSAADVPQSVFDQAQSHWKNRFQHISKMQGTENPYQLHHELGELMIANVLIVRENPRLEKTLQTINDMEVRWNNIKCVDTTDWGNPVPSFINQLYNMIHLAKIITKGALMRDEFRGAHYKPAFDLHQPGDFDPASYLTYLEQTRAGALNDSHFKPEHLDFMKRFEENNRQWLKTTIAQYRNGQPEISYEAVDTSLLEPRPRKYD